MTNQERIAELKSEKQIKLETIEKWTYGISDYRTDISKIDEKIALIEQLEREQSGRAAKGQKFWTLAWNFNADQFVTVSGKDDYDFTTNSRFAGGFYFLTEAEAQHMADRFNLDLLIAKWQRENDGDFVADWGNLEKENWCWFYYSCENEWRFDNFYTDFGQPNFSSKAKAQECFAAHEELIKRVWGI